MSNAWVFQKAEQVAKLGEDGASWYVGWYEPNGRRRKKSCGPGGGGKKLAQRLKRKLEAELMTGTYQMKVEVLWDDFVREYERRVLAGKTAETRRAAVLALAHFKRLARPVRVFAIDTAAVDDFVAARRKEHSPWSKAPVSPATVNKELRHVKAALRKAKKWGYLKEVPDFDMECEPEKLPTYLPPDHFAALYEACEQTPPRWPDGFPFTAADWWQALLMTGYLTGWRIGQLMGLRREDLDLEQGAAVTRWRAAGNKGKRDQLIPLNPVVVEHLRRLACFDPFVFPWPHGRCDLHAEFRALQDRAGVRPQGKKHYGFHDLRRAFATMNADRLTPDTLQRMMQHRDYQTTQRYINLARQLRPAAADLYVPPTKRPQAGGAS